MNNAPVKPESLAWRLAAIFAPLAVLVAARFRILGPWTVPIWTRLTRAARRLAHVLAHPPAPRASPAGARRSRGGPPPIRLPHRHGFLLAELRHEAGTYTQRLERLLAEPDTIARLVANPAALRTLRPFCRLLGVTLPQALRPPRRARPVLPSGSRLGRNPVCAPPDPPRPRRPVPPEGCWCSNPSAGPYWPFPRRATGPPGPLPTPA